MDQFGQSAAEMFAFSLGSVTRQPVRIEFRGSCAHTDGTTIVIPQQSNWNEAGLRTACGLIAHEHTHLWFQSMPFYTETLESFPKENRHLAANILNAVLDVADETRFTAIMPRADDLFSALAESALAEARTANALPEKPKRRVSLWQLLAAGIWLVRAKPRSPVRREFRGWRTRVAGMPDVFRILARARERSRPTRLSPHRSDAEWIHLSGLVDEMFDRLSPLFPPEKTSPPGAPQAGAQSTPQTDPADSGTDPRGRWNKVAVRVVSPDDGKQGKPSPQTTPHRPAADDQRGDAQQDKSASGNASPRERSKPATTPGASPAIGLPEAGPNPGKGRTDPTADAMHRLICERLERINGSRSVLPGSVLPPPDEKAAGSPDPKAFQPVPVPIKYHAATYEKVYPAFLQSARALATGPTLSHEHGHLSGNRISRPHRAMIDGRCFRRSNYEESIEASVAMLFDHSHSMRSTLPVFLPVGVAMADALDAQSDVTVAVWRFGREIERMKRIHDLKDAQLMGSTMTHLALAEAGDWLDSDTADLKVVVLFTDGEPSRVRETSAEVVKLRSRRVRLLIGAIGLARNKCVASFPNTVVFDVEPSQAACSLQTAIRRIQR